ncbi:MAG: sigma 54-interacting transcriptional regulator [Thermoflavifilum sp.]|nr:sigma 54-interacting transcriptional regulator [Thermoflavifilum sp.]MCL6514735.1 sigma 54-interacting transcriptional regulator [Alicyclobacillus sp.]
MADLVSPDLWRTYQEICEWVPVGVHIVDKQGRTRVYNRVMGEIDGYEPAQALDKSLFDLYDLTEETSTLWKALTTGKPIVVRRQVYFARNGRRIVTRNRTKPIVLGGEVIGAIEIAHPEADASPSRRRLYTLDDVLGESTAIRRALDLARRAARTRASVLISGETGVGKELFAQGIHTASPRAAGPFVAQNCAALPAGLLEGMLFGTRRGGFTGAVDRPGLFEMASGGTLLFDEVHTLDPSLQAKLLRVLQEQTVLPIGGTREVRVDVRVIATLNVPPRQALERGLLREDLLYRLSAVYIHVPPLRDRREDIPLLLDHFVRVYSDACGIDVPGVEPEVVRWCLDYDWPGNVRQIEHMVEGAIALADPGRPLALAHLLAVHPLAEQAAHARPPAASSPTADRTQRTSRRLDLATISAAYRRCGGNVSAAARELGISRQRLQYYLRRYGLRNAHDDPRSGGH